MNITLVIDDKLLEAAATFSKQNSVKKPSLSH